MPSLSPTHARLRALAAALLASAALLAAAPARAGAPGEEGTRLPLPGPAAVSATPQDDPRELLVRFSGPADAARLAGLAGRSPDWVEAVSVGYDSALIRFTRPVLATLAGDGIEVAPAPAPPAAGPGAPPVPADAAERRLEILRAQVLARDGDPAGARRRLLALGAAGGEDAEAALSLADVEAGLGHARRALDLYDRVLAREPDRDEAAFARRRLSRERGPQLRGDLEFQSAEGADTQAIATLRGRAFLSDLVEAGVTSEARRVRADELRAPDGAVGSVDATRARAEAYLSIGFDEGDALRLSLFPSSGPSSGGLGAGIGYLTRALGGETEVTADLRRPYWELVQGIVHGGRVDRVALRHERPLAHRLTGGASVRASRYGVDGVEDAGRSVGVSATLRYALVEGDPRLSLGYGLDGEYASGVAERTDATGAAYRPLDLGTREIHAIDLNAGGRFGRGWLPGLPASAEPDGPGSWEAFAGWAFDRFGGAGPFLGGTLLLNAAEALDLGAQASYSAVSAGRGDGAVLRLGAFAVARF